MKLHDKRRLRWRKGLRVGSSVNLISMMDVLTVLLLFLLKSYVAEGEIMSPVKGVRLPASTAEQAPRATLVVSIDGNAIRVGNEQVTTVAEAMASDSPEIAPLADKLQALRAQPAVEAAVDPRLVTIQGDRAIQYRVLRKVMFTLSRSGFDNVSLAVLRNT